MNRLQEKLKQYHVILGSQSPRRKQLLQGLDIEFTVQVKDTDELYPSAIQLHMVPEFIALNKFKAFIPQLTERDLVITADTIVLHNQTIVHKPIDTDDAVRILQTLSGSSHTVITGVCYGTKQKYLTFSAQSQVHFAHLTQADIDYYVTTYMPMDKAGAYGVQEWIGYIGIQGIEGSYFNVMGLPVQMLYQKLLEYEE